MRYKSTVELTHPKTIYVIFMSNLPLEVPLQSGWSANDIISFYTAEPGSSKAFKWTRDYFSPTLFLKVRVLNLIFD